MTQQVPTFGSRARLDGWKEIAAHCGRTVRTIQRWERDLALPIRRLVHASGATVYAYAGELDDWLRRHTAHHAAPASDDASIDRLDADALCRMSRHHWLLRTREGFRRSLALARSALQRDPTHARSHAMLALVYLTRASYGQCPPASEIDLAREAIASALQLDPSVVEGHQALGFIRFYYEWDWARAQDAFQTALRLSPSDPTTYQWLSVWHLVHRRDDEACAFAQRAEEVDQQASLIYPAHTAWVLYYAGRWEEAIVKARALIRRDPHYWWGYFTHALALVARGEFDAARHAIELAVALYDNTALAAVLVHALEQSGAHDQAEQAWTHLQESGEYVSSYWMAYAARGRNRNDRALEYLAAAVAAREWFVLFLNHEPVFRDLRGHPAFAGLCRSVGFP